VTKTTSLE
jgi:hypothetical protein